MDPAILIDVESSGEKREERAGSFDLTEGARLSPSPSDLRFLPISGAISVDWSPSRKLDGLGVLAVFLIVVMGMKVQDVFGEHGTTIG